jgi:predicted AAA+ superfamily ATPase
VELADQFDLSFSLKWGHLPALLQEEDPKKFLKSYIQTYLKEEVQQEALTRNLAQFSRFLEIASFSQGSAINVSEIARETGTNRVQIQTYFSILEDLLISSLLPIFTKRAKRRMANHPKFYFFDTGVFRTIRPLGPLDTQAEVDGPALETLCLQELRAINDYFELDYSLYYWRTQTGHEVDFILYGPHGLIAIEIKRKATLNKDDLSGLRLFKEDYPEALCLIFYGGPHKEYHGTITAIPMAEALKTLPSLLQPNQ